MGMTGLNMGGATYQIAQPYANATGVQPATGVMGASGGGPLPAAGATDLTSLLSQLTAAVAQLGQVLQGGAVAGGGPLADATAGGGGCSTSCGGGATGGGDIAPAGDLAPAGDAAPATEVAGGGGDAPAGKEPAQKDVAQKDAAAAGGEAKPKKAKKSTKKSAKHEGHDHGKTGGGGKADPHPEPKTKPKAKSGKSGKSAPNGSGGTGGTGGAKGGPDKDDKTSKGSGTKTNPEILKPWRGVSGPGWYTWTSPDNMYHPASKGDSGAFYLVKDGSGYRKGTPPEPKYTKPVTGSKNVANNKWNGVTGPGWYHWVAPSNTYQPSKEGAPFAVYIESDGKGGYRRR
jgi:hypothetical protein